MSSAPAERFRLPEAGEARVPPEARGLTRDQVRLAVVTPERTLHLLALLGGWPGAILARRRFRHKTMKVPFLIAF